MHTKVRQLRQLLKEMERPAADEAQVSSGCWPLDAILPRSGFARGSLIEWLVSGQASGAGLLALLAARQACGGCGILVIVDCGRLFYPPAAAAFQIRLDRTIVVHPVNEKDECWALDQALRCPHVSAVLAWPRRFDSRTFRRLQLAAAASGCLGLFVRPVVTQKEPSWADVRLLVTPEASRSGWRLQVKILRCRGHIRKDFVELEIDEQTGEIHAAHPCPLVPRLACPETGSRQTRA